MASIINSMPPKIMLMIKAKHSYIAVIFSAQTPSVHGIPPHFTRFISRMKWLKRIQERTNFKVLKVKDVMETCIFSV